MKLLIVGYGKMGRLVEELAVEQGFEIVGRVDQGRDEWADADVAIDFSTADALLANFTQYVARRMPVVIGTTGWNAHVDRLRAEAERAGIGVVASGEFFDRREHLRARRGRGGAADAGAAAVRRWIHEIHHAAKRDAPSGTALLLRDAMIAAGFNRPIDMSSARAGMIPGTHTVGFDSASDTIELMHRARDRRGFASGALLAARWIHGRTGWYSMQDVLKG